MAEMAVGDGIAAIVATPHQLGSYAHNDGDTIRALACELQDLLAARDIPLTVLPGADVRIEPEMASGLVAGSVLSLADRRRHVLLELPHETYIPLQPVLRQLAGAGLAGILSHPERNQGLLRQPQLLAPLVEQGCLMQITAGSLLGAFGHKSQVLCETMLGEGLVHFVATDAHAVRARRPLLSAAFARTAELTSWETAESLFSENPRRVANGEEVDATARLRKTGSFRWFWKRKAA